MKAFYIDTKYLTSVDYNLDVEYDGRKHILIGSRDHSEFRKLRFLLTADRLIKFEPNFVNGDIVLEPFTLNSYQFNVGDQFPCASAMKFRIKNEN